MGAGSDILGSLIGRAAPALLVIHDYREEMKRLNQKDAAGLALLNDALKGGKFPANAHPDKKIFEVQFNPSELNMDVLRDKISKTEIGERTVDGPPEGGTREASDAISKCSAEFSITLIFDHVINQDAFTSDKAIPTVSAVAGDIIQLSNRTYTVQKEIEGLLSALCSVYTRLITFRWGDFVFTGVLNDVSAKYTMFSLSGRPIRGTVDLTLVQSEADDTLAAWAEDYDQAFKNGGDFNKLSQTVGAVLNLPL